MFFDEFAFHFYVGGWGAAGGLGYWQVGALTGWGAGRLGCWVAADWGAEGLGEFRNSE